MADPSLVIRVAANLTELRANLEEGKSQIETTTAAMNKLAASFQGDRLIQQAHNVVAAVNEIGGASRLTEAEQARVNATLEKALDKYAAMGREAPAGMRELFEATKQVEGGYSDLLGTLGEVAAAFGVAFSIERAVEFVHQMIEEADALKNLSLQTHINIEDLQVLSAAVHDFGVDGEQLGRALFQLQQRIAGGDESVATAYHLMGLSLDEVKGKNAMELFLLTERGLGSLSGAIQDTAAKDLYGGRLGASMIAFSSGVDEAMEKARRLNTIASTESVKALAEYADAIDRAQRSLHAYTIEILGASAQGFNVLTDAVDKGASKWDLFVAMVKDWASSSTATGANASYLATLLDHLNQQTDQNTTSTQQASEAHHEAVKALDAHAQAAQFMAALQLDVGKSLLDWQRQYLDELRLMGQLNTQNAAAIGVTINQLKAYEEQVKITTETEKILSEFHKKTIETAAKAEKEFREQQFKEMQVHNKDVADAALQIKAIQDQLADALRQQSMSTTDYAIDQATRAAEERIRTFKGTADQHAVYEELIRNQLAQTVDQIRGSGVTLIGEAQDVGSAYEDAFDEASNACEAFVGTVIKGTQQLLTFIPASVDELQNEFVKMSNIGTPSGVGAGMLYTPGVQKRQGGGPVTASTPYLVGERGPELFVPDRAGTILPHGGGGVSVANYITINGSVLSDESKIAKAVGDAMMTRLRNLGTRFAAIR